MHTASHTNHNANMAHRLRGHLAVLLNSLEVIRFTPPGPVAAVEIERAERGIRALCGIARELENPDR